MRCFVVAGFLLTSASHGRSAIAELLVSFLKQLCFLILSVIHGMYVSTFSFWVSFW